MNHSADLLRDWTNWIGENHHLGVPHSQIVEIMVANGFDPSSAVQMVSRVSASAPVDIHRTADVELKKLKRRLDVAWQLWWQHASFGGVDRLTHVRPDVFLKWYYGANRPTVLLDCMTDWRALDLWTADYLKARCGSQTVEVMTGREADPVYEINSQSHKTHMRFDRYIDLVESGGRSNDFYMVANNPSFETGDMRRLLSDVAFFDGLLDAHATAGKVFFWFGPAGTVTPLHYDTMNVLLAQVTGRKKVTLVPSFQSHLVYNRIGVYSDVDCEAPDYDRYPLFRQTCRQEILLEPGQALFIPVGWWHHVRSLDVSISVSFTNFQVPNTYVWED
jgi:Cupin-like domain